MTAASIKPRKRSGRPREFDPDVALAAMVDVFWRTGYEHTSIAQIEQATGVVRTSLYHHYGSKEAMFAAAVSAYYASVGQFMGGLLRDGEQGLADLDGFFVTLTEQLTTPDGPAGCLVLSNVDEIVGIADMKNLPVEYVASFSDYLTSTLERAVALGEITADSVARRTAMLSAALIGVNVTHRTGQAPEDTVASINDIRAEIASWSLSR